MQPPINLIQRIILWMGCNALILLWLQPPVYQITADGTRLEHNLEFFWNIPPDWSVNVPLLAVRLSIIVLVTLGMTVVFKTGTKKEASK